MSQSVDQTIEVTVNKDTQTTGGTTKFSLKQSAAVMRYYITVEHRRCFLRKIKNMVKNEKSDNKQEEMSRPGIQKDETTVETVLDTA